MRKRKKRIVGVLLLLLITSFVLLMNDTLGNEKDKRVYDISVITRGKSSESSMIMRQGIDQAASETDVNIKFITLSEDNSSEEQKKIIEKEIKNKTDAIVIAPADYEEMAGSIESALEKLPVVMIESTIKSDKELSTISCDNYTLGVNLAKEVIKNGNNNSNITIIENNLECSSIKERYDGFMSVINNTNNKCSFLQFSDNSQVTYYRKVEELLENGNVDVIVTFDSNELEGVAKAKKDFVTINKNKAGIQIYGTGSTSKIISYLEDKVINATAIQNEFNIGYLGIKTAVDKLGGKKADHNTISSTVINKENMYSEQNQKLLFPFSG